MKPLNNLLCGQSAALRAHSLLVYRVDMPRRSLRGALHIDLLATVLRGFK
jgi:hypothetical protein